MSKCVVWVNAGNDRNGNSRRAYLVYERGRMNEIYIEDGTGRQVLPTRLRAMAPDAALPITPGAYRALKRQADQTRKMMSGAPARRRGRAPKRNGRGRFTRRG